MVNDEYLKILKFYEIETAITSFKLLNKRGRIREFLREINLVILWQVPLVLIELHINAGRMDQSTVFCSVKGNPQ